MFDVNSVIQIALAEVGYKEKASNAMLDDKTANAGSGNWTKYARDIDLIPNFYNGKKNGYDWCDIFVDWCFIKAYGVENAMKLLCQPSGSAGAGCTYSAQYYMSKEQFALTPKIGDQVFFGSSGDCYHTGLVVAVDGNRITTVEGNVTQGVNKLTYNLPDGRIYGYGRPNYDISATVVSGNTVQNDNTTQTTVLKANVKLDVIRFGMTGLHVKLMQDALIYHGYSCGIDGADGDFGDNTLKALKRFQTDNHLNADGVCGESVWKELL